MSKTQETIPVTVEFHESSQPPIKTEAINTYTKGPLFCIYLPDGLVQKIPLRNIWRIKEGYSA